MLWFFLEMMVRRWDITRRVPAAAKLTELSDVDFYRLCRDPEELLPGGHLRIDPPEPI